ESLNGSGGFGYDPLFYYEDCDKTFGEMSAEEKNKISHRGKALEKLKERIYEVI
ncbi:MAG: non-canonical purine NTP pyrophosphatase, partial [Clostridium baratii]|nr:non-canonical purine NTP pyrophosphatase [Clostridium baratii]